MQIVGVLVRIISLQTVGAFNLQSNKGDTHLKREKRLGLTSLYYYRASFDPANKRFLISKEGIIGDTTNIIHKFMTIYDNSPRNHHL